MHIDAELSPDLGFKVSSERVDKLFEEAALALTNIVIDTHAILRKETKKIELSATSLDDLMHVWLSEINFLFHYEKFLAAEFVVEISNIKDEVYQLHATISGEYPDSQDRKLYKRVNNTLLKEHKLEQLEDGSWAVSVFVYTGD